MRINGEWHVGDDGIIRPILRGETAAADGSWVQVLFLVDTGADCTALSADTLAVLGFPQARRVSVLAVSAVLRRPWLLRRGFT